MYSVYWSFTDKFFDIYFNISDRGRYRSRELLNIMLVSYVLDQQDRQVPGSIPAIVTNIKNR
jgi:hypothetical protein